MHLWRARLDLPAAALSELATCLTASERARASRFHFEAHRRRFVARHCLLRMLLGRYLAVPPAELRFVTGPHGKPRLAEGDVEFSTSHSHELAVFAFGRRCVGVDVERVRADAPIDAIARYFSAAERRAIATAGPEARLGTFYACWTCKEAYVKAIGVGLALPLDAFDAAAALTGEWAVLPAACGGAPAGARALAVGACVPDAGYVAALAVQLPLDAVTCFESRALP